MALQQPTMDELLSRHELAFSTRFASLLSQFADEGIGLLLPVVVIEHIYNSESNLGIVKAQARKFAKELSNIVDGKDEDYFELLKVKEVECEERGVQVQYRELIMILNCKVRAANYSIYHDLNIRVERRLRLSAYIFDEEGCVYPDKSAKKTPLDKNKLRAMFIPNPAVTKPILVDHKEERRREETRLHKKPRYMGGFPKEIKMGQVLMPPYYWHKMGAVGTLNPRQSGLVEEITRKQLATTSTQTRQQPNSSTLDPRRSGLVEEIVNKEQESMSTQSHRQVKSSTFDSRRSELVAERVDQRPTTSRQGREDQRTPDPRHPGLIGNRSHADINALMINTQDRRSVLISDEETNLQTGPIEFLESIYFILKIILFI